MTVPYSKDPLICSECGGIAYLKTFVERMPDGTVYRRGDCLVCTSCGKQFPVDDSFDVRIS